LGGYRVLAVLGAGGMGVVFRAEDPRLRRPVALKVMRPEIAGVSTVGQRFLREARATAAVKHDNVVTIYQVDEDRGIPFLVMELLEGLTLEERLRQAGRLPLTEAVRIAHQIALGLAAAHGRGLTHRDIKPANVWLENRSSLLSPSGRGAGGAVGRVKLLDFGLVQMPGETTPGPLRPKTCAADEFGGPCRAWPSGERRFELDERDNDTDMALIGTIKAADEVPSGLSRPLKLPEYAYNLPATACNVTWGASGPLVGCQGTHRR
jgi:serine/threonine protein kinase